jgi:hypothetical protein
MRSCASSASRPIAQAVINESGIAYRPARSHARAIFSRRSAHSSGVAITVLYSSAKRAAGTTVPERPLPPTMRWGWGPSPQKRRTASICSASSSTRRLISGNGKPNASCSASIQPVPMPSETRPREIWNAVWEAFASTAG